jgi:outer membrane protein TolC
MLLQLKITLFIMALVGLSSSWAVEINESYLKTMAEKGAPALDQIQAAFLGSSLKEGEVREKFAPEIFAGTSYAETNERPIITFIPIFSPIKQAQVGIRQNLKSGLSAELQATTDQRSAVSPGGTYTNVTTTSVSFTVQMDLWKDLLGRLSKLRLSSAQLETKKAQLENMVQTRSFHLSLRRVYWSLVANQESMKISQQLLKTAERQLKETQDRFKNAVAESDEVARYAAQLSSRQGTLTYLQYQRETLIKQLKNLLPELMQENLVLGNYDLTRTFDQVLACTAQIASYKKVPYEYTHYDEISGLLRQLRSSALELNARSNNPDLKFFGRVRSTGIGSDVTENGFRGSYGASVDDMTGHNRAGYEVGVNLTLPLGDVREENKNTRDLLEQKRLSAVIDNNDAQVINTHQQLVRSIALLNEVIKSQRMTTQQLEKRLGFVKRKYQQARASVNDLIQDQDALLNSELMTIDTQLQILNVLFDYLAIYTETPCEFNRT